VGLQNAHVAAIRIWLERATNSATTDLVAWVSREEGGEPSAEGEFASASIEIETNA
jgi:hypothetical protein